MFKQTDDKNKLPFYAKTFAYLDLFVNVFSQKNISPQISKPVFYTPIVKSVFFVFGPCFVMQYFVSFLNLQCWGREGWLLYFYCLLYVMLLLLFFASS